MTAQQYLKECGCTPGHIGGSTVHFLLSGQGNSYWLRHDHEWYYLKDANGVYVSFSPEQVADARRHYLSFNLQA